jgi:hypothetical protein
LWERDEDEARRGSPSKTAAERVGTERVALVSAAVDRPGATDGKPASPVPVVGSNFERDGLKSFQAIYLGRSTISGFECRFL